MHKANSHKVRFNLKKDSPTKNFDKKYYSSSGSSSKSDDDIDKENNITDDDTSKTCSNMEDSEGSSKTMEDSTFRIGTYCWILVLGCLILPGLLRLLPLSVQNQARFECGISSCEAKLNVDIQTSHLPYDSNCYISHKLYDNKIPIDRMFDKNNRTYTHRITNYNVDVTDIIRAQSQKFSLICDFDL